MSKPMINIKDFVKGKVCYDEPMKKHTSFQVGGPAEIWVEPDDADDLLACLKIAKEHMLNVIITGSGTNLLVRDRGVRGMVISMTSARLKKIHYSDFKVSASSAVRTADFLRFLTERGLAGLEFLAGIPGTIGGAVSMNAGARHYVKKDIWNSIGDFTEEVKCYDLAGNRRVLSGNALKFGYRSSNLPGLVITEIKFQLKKGDRKDIAGECGNYLKKKRMSQDVSLPSAGCVFKNPTEMGVSAGEIIEKCFLKNRRLGRALVSPKHANFIVNTGGATSDDIMGLVEIVRNEVKKKFGIQLDLEIKIV